MITREQFIEAYCNRSKQKPGRLEVLGYRVARCGCDAENCEGWQMLHGDSLADFIENNPTKSTYGLVNR